MQRPWYWWFRTDWFIFVLAAPVAVVSFYIDGYLIDAGAETLTLVLVQLLLQLILIGGPYILFRKARESVRTGTRRPPE